jgi:serine acetyltransferase
MLFDIIARAKTYWQVEILGGPEAPFKWRRIWQKCKRSNRYRYLFWFRLAYVMNESKSKFWRRRGKLLNEKISRRHNVEIMSGAKVGLGLWIAHPTGIVITSHACIGENFRIWQNCTIGIKGVEETARLVIGNGVRLNAHACVIGDDLELGDNVVIGAGSLVMQSVPADHVFYNQRPSTVKPSNPASMGRLQQ